MPHFLQSPNLEQIKVLMENFNYTKRCTNVFIQKPDKIQVQRWLTK